MTAPLWERWERDLPPLFARLLDLEEEAVAWRSQPRRTVRGPRAQLDVIASAPLGVDDRRWNEEPAGTFVLGGSTITGRLVEELHGQRIATLQVSIWNDRQPIATSSRAHIERLRTRLDFESTKLSLRALGLAFVRTEAPVSIEPSEDGRRVSGWAVDVVLAYAAVEADVDAPTNWFESARIYSQSVRGPDGAPAQKQVDITVDLAPEA